MGREKVTFLDNFFSFAPFSFFLVILFGTAPVVPIFFFCLLCLVLQRVGPFSAFYFTSFFFSGSMLLFFFFFGAERIPCRPHRRGDRCGGDSVWDRVGER